MTTWRKLITARMAENGEQWDDVVSTSAPDGTLEEDFDDSFGGCEGHPFTVWTKRRVYFPTVYDGAEDVRSVPRDPNEEMTRHVGGGASYYIDDDDDIDDLLKPGDER